MPYATKYGMCTVRFLANTACVVPVSSMRDVVAYSKLMSVTSQMALVPEDVHTCSGGDGDGDGDGDGNGGRRR